jgi:hypothetical protein
MARLEADREDLMREATALVRRAEYRVPEEPEGVIMGLRSSGALSIFCGADPVVHLDGDGRLRRAFVGGHLYRTQGTTLARLHRTRSDSQVVLRRQDLSPPELTAFLGEIDARLSRLAHALSDGTATCVQQVPAGEDVAAELSNALGRVCSHPLRLAPAIRGKR